MNATTAPGTKITNKDRFEKSILDQTKDYPAPEALLTFYQNQTAYPFLTLKSISLWHGKAKSKKTTALAIVVAAYISKLSNLNPIRFEQRIPGKVLFFDTEQGQSYAARTMKLILSLAYKATSDQLIYCDLREFTPDERVGIISAAMTSTLGVKLVIIDGIVDLMNDFMDAAQGHTTVLNLLRLSSEFNVHIAGILHQNKGDNNARAHVGSIMTQKSELEISVESDTRDRTVSVVKCERSRGMAFEDFYIRWERDNLPQILQNGEMAQSGPKTKIKPHELKEYEIQPLLNEMFKSGPSQRHSDLLTNTILGVSKLYESIGQNSAREFIQHFLNEGFIKTTGTPGTKTCFYSIRNEAAPF